MSETIWHATLDPDISAISVVKPHILACFDERVAGIDAMLACDEVLANIATHADATQVDVTIERADGQVRVTFSDDGVPFDLMSFEPVKNSFEDWAEGGMGIRFVRQVASEIAYEYTGGRNVLTLGF